MEKTNGFGFFNRVDWQTYDYVLGLLHDAANELELETELEERLQPILKNVELSIKAMHDALTAAKLSGLYRDPDFP